MLAGPTKLSPDRLFDKVQVENGLHCPEEHTIGGGAVLQLRGEGAEMAGEEQIDKIQGGELG